MQFVVAGGDPVPGITVWMISLGRGCTSDVSVDMFMPATKRLVADVTTMPATKTVCLGFTFRKHANNS